MSSRVEQPVEALLELASDFSPRYELVRPHLVIVEIDGLDRLLGTPREIGEAFCRMARERAMMVTIGIAATHTAALLLALHHADAPATVDAPLTVVPSGREAAALAPLSLTLLAALPDDRLSTDDVAYLRRRPPRDANTATATAIATAAAHPTTTSGSGATSGKERKDARAHPPGKTRGWRGRGSAQNYRLAPSPGASRDDRVSEIAEVASNPQDDASRWTFVLDVLHRWGLKTLGELARLPAVDLFGRLGRDGVLLQQIARGQDARPLVPTTAYEPFEATLALDWPIDTLEPLSFVLTRMFEPLCARLERCDRGAAILDVTLLLVTRAIHTRRLELPAPMRDPKVLRTLVLLDLESHPPDAGIDRITLTIEPTPGRIVQHSLLARALPSPEQISTLTARLSAIMGEGRVGAPVLVDTHRPEAFEMRRFEIVEGFAWAAPPPTSHRDCGYVLRRFRRIVPARVRLEQGRPVHVSAQGLAGGSVVQAAGPWRTSGEWWKGVPALPSLADLHKPAESTGSTNSAEFTEPAGSRSTGSPSAGPKPPALESAGLRSWHRDEWDVALDNGCLYRIHHDVHQNRWFVEASLD